MPRRLISDAHEWINEIPAVPIYCLANPQPRARAWANRRGKKTLLSLTLVWRVGSRGGRSVGGRRDIGERRINPSAGPPGGLGLASLLTPGFSLVRGRRGFRLSGRFLVVPLARRLGSGEGGLSSSGCWSRGAGVRARPVAVETPPPPLSPRSPGRAGNGRPPRPFPRGLGPWGRRRRAVQGDQSSRSSAFVRCGIMARVLRVSGGGGSSLCFPGRGLGLPVSASRDRVRPEPGNSVRRGV
jgi:hypothetical protein